VIRRVIALGFALALTGGVASAQVVPESYATLLRQLDGLISFETLPRNPEPGFNLNAPMRVHGAWLGERLAGQRTGSAPSDVILGIPSLPLAVAPGMEGQNLSVAFHRGFGSNALFPVGPGGFTSLGGRGEGAATILFDRDQAAFGLRIHADYADPLGKRPTPGKLQLALYSRTGALIARTEHVLGYGVTEIGLRRDGDIPDIAAVVITNTDPGGIAIDDILFQLTALIG
jgi:hypothetical protein